MQIISFWPILISSIISFAISSIWYAPALFGKKWMEANHIGETDVAEIRSRGIKRRYLFLFILSLVEFSVLAFIMAGTNVSNTIDGAFVGFLAWLGFMIPLTISGALWKRDGWKLFCIDSIHYLLTIVIGGAIIGAWR